MAKTDAVTLDPWSHLNHKSGMAGGDDGSSQTWKAPTWLGTRVDTVRRLAAYVRLAAYRTNQGREFIRETDADARLAWREYGEFELFGERIAAGVLGSEPQFGIDGASDPVPSRPDIPERPSDDQTGDPEIDALIASTLEESWREGARRAVEEWQARRAEAPALAARQEWLRAWASTTSAISKLRLNESNATMLGDAVVEVGWDPHKADPITGEPGCPTLTVYEPDAYHPVLSDAPGDDYPHTVHLAWEFEADDGDTYVRRITYRLAPNGKPGEPLTLDSAAEGESWRPAYSAEPSTVMAYYSDVVWPYDALGKRTVWDLTPAKGTPERITLADGTVGDAVDVPLNLDYLPIVHFPNSETNAHFGVSSLARVLQLVDDISKTDADLQSAGELAGLPPVSVPGTTSDDVTIAPGAVFGRGDADGGLKALDTSSAVRVLIELREALASLLAVNVQVPKGLVGKVEASEVPSGLALSLTFTSFIQLIEGLRLVRNPKHRLVVKMVQRAAIVGGTLTGEALPGGLNYGTYMPNDVPGVIDAVVKLLNAKAISTQTALRLLDEAGITVEDIEAEIAAIRSVDGATARDIADATESVELAARYLGVEIPIPEEETTPPSGAGDDVDPDAPTPPARPALNLR